MFEFDVTEGREDAPTLKQLSVFLPNRVGSLLRVTRSLDNHALNVLAVHVVDAADHAVVRFLVDRPALAADVLAGDGYSVVENELLGVVLPEVGGVGQVLRALLMGELNVHYVYTFVAAHVGQSILALHVEDTQAAAHLLTERGLEMVSHDQLG